MPFIKVNYEDTFHYLWEATNPHDWWNSSCLREATEEEIAEVARLHVEAKKLQALLETIYQRPEPAESVEQAYYGCHVYCAVCSECITCNLRPCRDGREHTTFERWREQHEKSV